MKTQKYIGYLVLAATLCFSNLAVAAQPLPSDMEMLRQGRDAVSKHGDLNSLMDKAQRTVQGPIQPLTVPEESIPDEQSPLLKELRRDAMSTDLRKELANEAAKRGKSDLLIFVSFSMPDDVLALYSAQAKESGATIILRGLVEQSVTKTQQRAIPVNKPIAAWDINPGLFRKFNIHKVPAIVLADTHASQVVEDGCAQSAAFLEVEGDVSVRQALLLMRSRGDGLLAADAGERLAKLERK